MSTKTIYIEGDAITNGARWCNAYGAPRLAKDMLEQLTAMQARIEKLETAANKAVEWLHHYPSPDNMEEQMVMNAKRARGILEEALK